MSSQSFCFVFTFANKPFHVRSGRAARFNTSIFGKSFTASLKLSNCFLKVVSLNATGFNSSNFILNFFKVLNHVSSLSYGTPHIFVASLVKSCILLFNALSANCSGVSAHVLTFQIPEELPEVQILFARKLRRKLNKSLSPLARYVFDIISQSLLPKNFLTKFSPMFSLLFPPPSLHS